MSPRNRVSQLYPRALGSQPGGPGSRIYIPQEEDGPVIPPKLHCVSCFTDSKDKIGKWSWVNSPPGAPLSSLRCWGWYARHAAVRCLPSQRCICRQESGLSAPVRPVPELGPWPWTARRQSSCSDSSCLLGTGITRRHSYSKKVGARKR
jgi:hypothetical protein